MLTVLLVNNALSAETCLKSVIRRIGGQLVAQAGTLAAMTPLLKLQSLTLVLIDLPSQEETALPILLKQAKAYPDTFFLCWTASEKQRKTDWETVLLCARPVRLDPLLNQIADQAPALLQRSPALKRLAAQSRQIRQAKQVLMERGMSEDEAHHALEKMAMNLRISRGEAARQVLTENKHK